MNSVALERVGRLATATVAFTAVAAAVSIAAIWASQAAQDEAQALLADEITPEQFVQRAAPYLLMTAVQAVATLAAAVLTMIWMFRLAKNHRALHRGGTWGPGWAIGGWFLPPLLFVIPFLMLRELWKASDPDVPIGGQWKKKSVSALIPAWFVLYSLVPLVLLVSQTSGGMSLTASERDMAQQIVDNQTMTIVSAGVAIAGAAVFIAIVRGLTARHQRAHRRADSEQLTWVISSWSGTRRPGNAASGPATTSTDR